MKIIAISMVKNEADIVEVFVRRNLHHVDAIVLLDNLSTDGTREILSRLCAEGLPICVIDYPEIRYAQSKAMTGLLQRAVAVFQPDWMIPLDADEIIRVDAGRTLGEVLGDAGDGVPLELPWVTYVPTQMDDPNAADPTRRIRRRRSAEGRQYCKVAIPARVAASPGLILDQGNHSVSREGKKGTLQAASCNRVSVAHFPVRSAPQILGKAFVGWIAYLADPQRKKGHGYHWEEMYHRFLRDGEVSAAELEQLGRVYAEGDVSTELVEDPLPDTEESRPRYGEDARISPIVSVARVAETLAQRYAQAAGGDQGLSPYMEAHGRRGLVTLDVPPLNYLRERFPNFTVRAVGGTAQACAEYLDEAGSRSAAPAETGTALPAHGASHELVICLGAEDMSPGVDPAVLVRGLQPGPRVYFSAFTDTPKGGPGRIAEANARWLARWRECGWVPLLFESMGVRAVATLLGLRFTGLVLAPAEGSPGESPWLGKTVGEVRSDIGKEWFGGAQKVGTYRYPLLGSMVELSGTAVGRRHVPGRFGEMLRGMGRQR